MKTFAIAAASLGLVMTATPAFAGQDQFHTQSVSTAGLDLSTAEGQRMLEQRIERAARNVCFANEARTGSRLMSREVRTCLADARASARQQVAVIIEDQQRGG